MLVELLFWLGARDLGLLAKVDVPLFVGAGRYYKFVVVPGIILPLI